MAPFPMKSFPSLAGEIWHLISKQKTNSSMSPLFYQSRVGFTCIPKTCQLPQRCHKSAKLMMMAVIVPSSPYPHLRLQVLIIILLMFILINISISSKCSRIPAENQIMWNNLFCVHKVQLQIDDDGDDDDLMNKQVDRVI